MYAPGVYWKMGAYQNVLPSSNLSVPLRISLSVVSQKPQSYLKSDYIQKLMLLSRHQRTILCRYRLLKFFVRSQTFKNFFRLSAKYLVILTKPACQRDVATTPLAVCHLLALRQHDVISPSSQSGYIETNTQIF